MATPNIQDKQQLFRSRSMLGGVCKTRTDLLDRLAGALESLGLAKLSLETGSLTVDDVHAESIRNHVDGLRSECGIIRRELEFHRISHGC
jgi:hypothetical protein